MRGFEERKNKVEMLNVKLCYNLRNKIKRERESSHFLKCISFRLFLERWGYVTSLCYVKEVKLLLICKYLGSCWYLIIQIRFTLSCWQYLCLSKI